MHRLRIHRGEVGNSALSDTALSHALLRAVDAGDAPESLRLYRPLDALAFSVLDRTRPGFARAAAFAQEQGFEPVLRLAGGRAAVFEHRALAFAWTVPARDARAGIRARFAALSDRLARALRTLGIDAQVGEVEGEYCPGEFSVNARGVVKLVGVGQRVVRRAAHVGGVVIVRGAPRIAALLETVYRELGYPLDPSRTGAVADECPGLTADAVADALLAELARERDLEFVEIGEATRAAAANLMAQHVAEPGGERADRQRAPGRKTSRVRD